MYDAWYCFSPAKNNIKDAAACVAKGIPSYGAAEAEYNFYAWTNKVLAIAGVEIDQRAAVPDFTGFSFGPKILLDPTFAITFAEIKSKFKGQRNRIAKGATLILADGETEFENLDLGNEAMVCELGVSAKYKAIDFQPVVPGDDEIYQIRGYKPDL